MTDKTLYIRMAVAFFHQNKRGKFDWLEIIFNQKTLLNKSPEVLRCIIAEELGIDAQLIKYNSFARWHKRYRNRNTLKYADSSSAEKLHDTSVRDEFRLAYHAKNDDNEEWKNLPITDITKIEKKEERVELIPAIID